MTLFDEVTGMGYDRAYATFTRQLRARNLRPACELTATDLWGAVGVAQANTARRASAGVFQPAAPASVSRLRVALNDSASALSALEPTAPIDLLTPSRSHRAA